MQDHCFGSNAASWPWPYDLWEVQELPILASSTMSALLSHTYSPTPALYLLALSLHPRNFYAA